MTSLVLNDIGDALMEQLEQAAAANGTTVEEVAKEVLEQHKPIIFDSVQIVREGREWLDQRDEERAARGTGLREDLSHLDRMRS